MVAIKMLHADRPERKAMDRFRREMQTRRLDHPTSQQRATPDGK
jgi:hypothetical protein